MRHGKVIERPHSRGESKKKKKRIRANGQKTEEIIIVKSSPEFLRQKVP